MLLLDNSVVLIPLPLRKRLTTNIWSLIAEEVVSEPIYAGSKKMSWCGNIGRLPGSTTGIVFLNWAAYEIGFEAGERSALGMPPWGRTPLEPNTKWEVGDIKTHSHSWRMKVRAEMCSVSSV